MIATGLTFLFGALLTALVVLLAAPFVWRKAQSLARREFDATIPVSANEIRAGFDSVRAQAALAVRQAEMRAAETLEKSARTQAELGRATVENAGLRKRERKLSEDLLERDAELSKLDELVALREAESERLTQQVSSLRQDRDATRETLAKLEKRFRDLGEIAEERRLQLEAADLKLDRFADSLRIAERATREAEAAAERLRGNSAFADRTTGQEKVQVATLNDKVATLLAGIADRDEEILRLKAKVDDLAERAASAAAREHAAPSPSSGIGAVEPEGLIGGQRLRSTLSRRGLSAAETEAELADVREQISDLAARVLRMTSLAEGPGSPLAKVLETPSIVPVPAGGRRLSLAERVRLLAESEEAGGPAGRSQAAG